MTQEIFYEAVDVLNRLGPLLSSEYVTHTIKNDSHLLSWQLQYQDDEKPVLWRLFLKDGNAGIIVNGFDFDR